MPENKYANLEQENVGEWSEWSAVAEIKEARDQYRWPGVYKIRLADLKGKPIKIGRFLGEDKDGILLIGQSQRTILRLNGYCLYWLWRAFKVEFTTMPKSSLLLED